MSDIRANPCNPWFKTSGFVFASVFWTCAAFAGAERIDADWEFALRDFDFTFMKVGFGAVGGNDNGTPAVRDSTNGWTRVDLPHDWALDLPFAQEAGGGRAGFRAIGPKFPQNSVGWYRKRLAVPGESDGKRLFLRFDGIYRDAQVWLNGCYLGRNESGYVGCRFEVTDQVLYGSTNNCIAVRVDATRAEGWWYDGAGVNRHVWLETVAPDGVVPDSVAIALKELKPGAAVMHVDYETFKEGAQGFDFTVAHPRLWSCEDPHLYELELKGETFRYGIRQVVFDPEKGLSLNGKRVPVQGVCCHQDHAGLGVAVPDAVQEHRIRRLKWLGVNAYRSSHNPPDPVWLDLCDRHGVLVMDETRLFVSSQAGLDQFARLVKRDRNHPCVVAWSIGNEEHNVHNADVGRRMAETFKRAARRLDPTRPVTYGGNNGVQFKGVNEVVDVRGVNYIRLMRGGLDRYHADHPRQPVWGSEEASTFATRGGETNTPDRIRFLRDGDEPENTVYSWASTARDWTTEAAKRPWFAGAFAWTGFDYRGECKWPHGVNNFGILDLCGYAKNNAWYYRARWTDEDVLHVYPNANRPRTNFWVNANCDAVRLFVNGTCVGEQKRPDGVYRLNFPCAFTSGVVEARGVRKGRSVVNRIETTGPLARIGMAADRVRLAADGADAAVIDLTALDAQGREIPDCRAEVRVRVSGAGKAIGIGNGDPSSHEPDRFAGDVWTRRFFNGKCQVIVRSARAPGALRVAAEADGLPPAALTLDVASPRKNAICPNHESPTTKHETRK